MCCCPADLFDPPAEFAADREKPRVVCAVEFGHIYMVGANSYWNIPGQNGGILWHNLPSKSIKRTL